MPLNVRSGFAFGTFPGLVNDPGMEGPRGNTVHFLMSAVSTINKNALFDSGSIALQFDAMHLDKITSGASLYNGEGGNPACTDNLVLRGCSTRNAASIALSFTPTWQQVFPSIDISTPLFVTYGLKGNAAAVGAGVTPKGSWLVRPGIRVEYLAGKYKHQFDLAYTARGGKTGNLRHRPGRSAVLRLRPGELPRSQLPELHLPDRVLKHFEGIEMNIRHIAAAALCLGIGASFVPQPTPTTAIACPGAP